MSLAVKLSKAEAELGRCRKILAETVSMVENIRDNAYSEAMSIARRRVTYAEGELERVRREMLKTRRERNIAWVSLLVMWLSSSIVLALEILS